MNELLAAGCIGATGALIAASLLLIAIEALSTKPLDRPTPLLGASLALLVLAFVPGITLSVIT